jgi:hypothetical protein
MALARIITRSQACSRELAIDLLARGYAVEIVSPDAIPDNIADLELRVDNFPGDQLIASVEAHDGERSASLEFVHHLKAPMVDFMRRPPEPQEFGQAVYFPEQPVSFNAEPSIEDVEVPAEVAQLAAKTVSEAAEILLDPATEQNARVFTPPEQLPSPPVEPPSYFAVAAPTIARPTIGPPTIVRPAMDQPRQAPQRRGHSAGWLWRAALTFVGVAVLAVIIGFGMRRTGKAVAQSSGAVPVEKLAAASTDVNSLSAADSEKDSGKAPRQVSASAMPPATNLDRNSGHLPKESPVARTGPSAATASSDGPRSGISRRHGNDLIARDTVTYLDKRFEQRASNRRAPKAKPAKPLARRHSSSRKHDGGVIAANTVTYLNNKPNTKAAK